AEQAAEAATTAVSETAQLVAAVQELTQTNAAMLAHMQAGQSADTAAAILPAGDLDPEVDIAPENPHWLARRWGGGLFGKKGDRS
ncbi:hypothetical protein, partial [Streptomyces sp. 900105245]